MNDQSQPVRTKPYQPSCYLAGDEIELVTECLQSLNWSSFKGGTEGWDIHECATMTSAQAVSYGATEIRFLGGRFVRALEAEVAEQTQTKFAISANSATSALIMALSAINLGPGDEVLMPCLSFNASATAVLFSNAVPVFCEIKPDTLCIDPLDVVRKITPRTRAIMVVHFAGNTADMDAIMAIAKGHGLKVIEDCAQSPGVGYRGKPVGSIGDAGIFSYTETKNISCGEGGMVVTNDEKIAFKSRLIRNHGEGVTSNDWPEDDLINVVGMNFRLTEIQAAVAIPQIRDLSARNLVRNRNRQRLITGLSGYADELIPYDIESGADFVCHVMYWRWVPKSANRPTRQELIQSVCKEGVPVGVAYNRLMHENPLYERRIAWGNKGCPWTCNATSETVFKTYGRGACPVSEDLNDKLISFRFVNPPNSFDDMDDVVAAFKKVLG
jgi:perosamine synthetase